MAQHLTMLLLQRTQIGFPALKSSCSQLPVTPDPAGICYPFLTSKCTALINVHEPAPTPLPHLKNVITIPHSDDIVDTI